MHMHVQIYSSTQASNTDHHLQQRKQQQKTELNTFEKILHTIAMNDHGKSKVLVRQINI